MKKAIAKKWTDALRSGKYKQGKRRLTKVFKTVEHDCCLGVLCKLAIEENIIEPAKLVTSIHPERGVGFKAYGKNDRIGTLPEEVCEWAGMRDDNPNVTIKKEESFTLTSKNDHGTTFKEIADIIDKHYKKL